MYLQTAANILTWICCAPKIQGKTLIILNVKQKFFRSVNQNRNLRDRWNWILEKWTFSVLKVFVLLPSPLGFIISRHGSLTPERTSGTTCQTALISSRWAVAMVTGPPVISRDVSAWNWNVKPPQKNRLSARGGNFYLLSSGAEKSPPGFLLSRFWTGSICRLQFLWRISWWRFLILFSFVRFNSERNVRAENQSTGSLGPAEGAGAPSPAESTVHICSSEKVCGSKVLNRI